MNNAVPASLKALNTRGATYPSAAFRKPFVAKQEPEASHSQRLPDGRAQRSRGRPARTYDNRRVRAVLVAWHTAASCGADEVDDQPPLDDVSWLDDILTGVSRLQTEGQKSTRPLDRGLILRVLLRCEVINCGSVAQAIARDYGRSQVDRYAAAARVASTAIERELQRRPAWVKRVEDDAAGIMAFDTVQVVH